MDNTEMENTGNLYFDKGILLSIVCAAVKETNGVVDMHEPVGHKFRKLLSENFNAGVKIKYTEFGIQIDANVIVKADIEVNDLVFRIQQNVKNAISSMINIPIKSINIIINDVLAEKKN